jgi:hypothetical protein
MVPGITFGDRAAPRAGVPSVDGHVVGSAAIVIGGGLERGTVVGSAAMVIGGGLE